MSETNLERVRRYFSALESGAVGDVLAAFFSPDVVQEEFPNRLVPSGARRNLVALLDGAIKGQRVMRRQRYEILNAIEGPATVVLEVQWTGTLDVPLGSLPVGGEMRARFAVFIELRDGKIIRQRNYDCFDPW